MSVRSSGRLSASSNHCYASNIQYIGDPSPVASMARKKRSSADEEVSGASRSSPRKKRLYEANEKVYILKAYVKLAGGRQQPLELAHEGTEGQVPDDGKELSEGPLR